MAPSCRVYVGNLPLDVRTREVEDLFYKYGRIRDIDVKLPTRPPAFAFVDFEDPRDAQDAIAARNGYDFDGHLLRVELANAGKRDGSKTSFGRNVRGSGEFALDISRLSSRASWRDLKDHMRRAGDVTYASVDGRGGGYVEFSNRRDMEYAIDKLDDTAVKCDGDKSYIRVRAAKKSRSPARRSRSRSPARRSRSPERRSSKKASSHKRSVSRSASASRSPSRDRKKSPPSRRNESRRSRSASASPERKKQSRGRSPSRSRSVSSRSRSNGKRVARDERKSSSPSAMETDDASRSPVVKDREGDARGDSDAEADKASK